MGPVIRRTKLRIEGKIRRTKSREADARGGGRTRGRRTANDISIFFFCLPFILFLGTEINPPSSETSFIYFSSLFRAASR
jgi:hypothetical protein